MSPEFIAQQVVNALSLGGTYALLALGLAIVFSIIGLINFAHGDLMTIAGYTLLFTLSLVSLPIAILAAAIVTMTMAVVIERVGFRPVRAANPATLLLTSFAISVLLQTGFQNFISARSLSFVVPELLAGTWRVGGLIISKPQGLSILTTAALLGVLVLFLRYTVMGMAMRAAAGDFDVTRLMGIRAGRIIATAFAISGLLACIAGLFWVTQRSSVEPLMGFLPVLKAFIAVILGGLGSLTGAVAGGMVLGIAEVTFRAALPEHLDPYRDAFTLALVIAILLVRPQGLFGRRALSVR